MKANASFSRESQDSPSGDTGFQAAMYLVRAGSGHLLLELFNPFTGDREQVQMPVQDLISNLQFLMENHTDSGDAPAILF
jgi:hypothetical protein